MFKCEWRMALWYRIGFYKDRLKTDILGSNTVNFFFIYLLRIVLSSLFSIKCLTYYLFHILISFFVLLILKQMFKSTCINWLSVLIYLCILYIMLFLKNFYCFCNMHRNSLIWSYQLFLPKPWLRTKYFFKGKKSCQ